MRISAKAEYACLAVIALAQQPRGAPPLRLREISEAYQIPDRYLVQILLQLKGAGLVASTRGASGGYQLVRSPATISLREVLEAVDGPDLLYNEKTFGKRSAAEVLRPIWESVREAERAVLDRTTIAEVAAGLSPHEWVI
jgi:Rrf2 family protein